MRDINDYVKISKNQHGQVKINHDKINEGNIYKLLEQLGYRTTVLDKNRIYFHRNESQIRFIKFHQVKSAFLNLLEKGAFANVPHDLDNSALPNWYYRKKPIKENGLLWSHICSELTELEIHHYKLENDCIYKERFENARLISKLEKWAMKKTFGTLDSKTSYVLFYKNLGDRKYLLFNQHKNLKGQPIHCFDSWITTFNNEKQIGIKNPLTIEEIRLGFQLDRDTELLKEYGLQ